MDIITEDGYLADLVSLDAGALRERRQMCADVDRELSFYRRLLQGRIDLIDFERRRRDGSETRTLVEALPEILGDGPRSGSGHVTAAVADVGPPPLPRTGSRDIDYVLGDDFLSRVSDLEDSELEMTRRRLVDTETEVSTQRSAVHAALDALSEELTHRYRSGAASVDDLLRS